MDRFGRAPGQDLGQILAPRSTRRARGARGQDCRSNCGRPSFARIMCRACANLAKGVLGAQRKLRSTDPSYKKTLCIWYQKGCCRNGTLCSFAHGESELRQQGSSSSEQRALPAKAAGRTPTLTSHRLAWTNSPASGAPFNGPSQVQIQAAGSDWPSVQQSPPVGPYSGHGCMGCGGHMPEFEDPHLQGPFPTLNSCSGPVQGPMPLNHVEEAVASLSDNLQSLTQQLQLLEGITRQYQLQQYPQPP
eukprot:g16764.t1